MVWIDEQRCRFCAPGGGGGGNYRVLRALYILAEAIRLDSSGLYDPIKEKIQRTGEESRTLSIVHKLLLAPFCPPALKLEKTYSAKSDDSAHELYVYIGPDSDVAVGIGLTACRFRTFFGGGRHLIVHKAAIILAEAMRLDTQED